MRSDKNQLFCTLVDTNVEAITSNNETITSNVEDITNNRALVNTNEQTISSNAQGGKYLVFVFSRSVKIRGFSFLNLHAF